jgi:hypothetical protein
MLAKGIAAVDLKPINQIYKMIFLWYTKVQLAGST